MSPARPQSEASRACLHPLVEHRAVFERPGQVPRRRGPAGACRWGAVCDAKNQKGSGAVGQGMRQRCAYGCAYDAYKPLNLLDILLT
jgi:hypothetical protein